MKLKIVLLLLCILQCLGAFAAETCSRTAIINYQEVLVDTNSSLKGDGLRFYLEKDPVALDYLNKYQEGAKNKWINAGLGTAGSLMILAGFLTTADSAKQSLMIAGVSTIVINFFVAKTLEHQNEVNLKRAIEEYNLRNTPKIDFGRSRDDSKSASLQINYCTTF